MECSRRFIQQMERKNLLSEGWDLRENTDLMVGLNISGFGLDGEEIRDLQVLLLMWRMIEGICEERRQILGVGVRDLLGNIRIGLKEWFVRFLLLILIYFEDCEFRIKIWRFKKFTWFWGFLLKKVWRIFG